MNAKDFYKKISKNQTSEKLFGIESAPDHTCPMIDTTLNDIRSFRAQLGSIQFKLNEYSESIGKQSSKKERLILFRQINSVNDQLNSWDRLYFQLEKELEILRSYLDSVRKSAMDYKEEIWRSIDQNIEINESELWIKIINKRWPSVNYRRPKADHSQVDSVIDSIKKLEKVIIDCEDLSSCASSEEIKMEVNLLIEGMDPNIFNDILDESLNKAYLEEWAEQVRSIHPNGAAAAFISFMEDQGVVLK